MEVLSNHFLQSLSYWDSSSTHFHKAGTGLSSSAHAEEKLEVWKAFNSWHRLYVLSQVRLAEGLVLVRTACCVSARTCLVFVPQ